MSKIKKSPNLKSITTNILSYLLVALFSITQYSCSSDQEESNEQSGFNINPEFEVIIDSVLNSLSLEEKISLIHGNGKFTSEGVPRLGIPEITYTDGPNGIREELEKHSWKPLNLTSDSATFFPTGTALAATWSEDLALLYGEGIGLEARARDKDILLGPGVNIIRSPLCGRNFEYFTEDPYLNSRIAVGYVKGVQEQDVAACVKHYAANNQEYDRSKVNVEMSERALREIYLPVYDATVKEADALAMMGAYNKFRGEHLCHNGYLNNTILKEEFNFKGIVVSDWNATHNTVKAALGGLDVEMGTKKENYDEYYMSLPLRDSVEAGVVSEEIIDDKVRRVLRVIYNTGMMNPERKEGQLATKYISEIAYDIASEAIVLLKNENQILPLDQNEVKSIAVIGQNAIQPQSFGGATASVKAKYEISPLDGLKSKLGDKLIITYAAGYEPSYYQEGKWGHQFPENKSNPELIDEAVEAAKSAEVAIVFVGTNRIVESEGRDRKNIDLPFGQDELISRVYATNPNTIVVVISGAACNLNTAKDNAPAILQAWYNGSETGHALANTLFGDINPSGKLPFTIPKKLEDIGAHAVNAYPGKDQVVEYKEDILVGYRWFDTKNIDPAFAFGHGLSYTDFEYSNLSVTEQTENGVSALLIELIIKNTGSKAGKEVVQCYVNDIESSVLKAHKELKAFQKIELQPNEEKKVTLNIPNKSLSYFNEATRSWVFEPGEYQFMFGSSSRDIRLKQAVNIY